MAPTVILRGPVKEIPRLFPILNQIGMNCLSIHTWPIKIAQPNYIFSRFAKQLHPVVQQTIER